MFNNEILLYDDKKLVEYGVENDAQIELYVHNSDNQNPQTEFIND